MHAQSDSLRNAPFYMQAQKQQQVKDSLIILTDTLLKAKPKKERNPLIDKNAEGRLQLNLKIPGRRPIAWKIPKVIYAGPSEFPDPEVSWKRSALIPGWGQIYNGDSWKLPIIYGGYAASIWYYTDRQKTYTDLRRAYRIRVLESQGEELSDTDIAFLVSENLDELSEDGLLRQRDQVRTQRDYSFLYITGWHIISILESYVGGHMKSVDITEDISMRVQPAWISTPLGGPRPGLGLALRF